MTADELPDLPLQSQEPADEPRCWVKLQTITEAVHRGSTHDAFRTEYRKRWEEHRTRSKPSPVCKDACIPLTADGKRLIIRRTVYQKRVVTKHRLVFHRRFPHGPGDVTEEQVWTETGEWQVVRRGWDVVFNEPVARRSAEPV